MHWQIQGWRKDLRPTFWTIWDPPLRRAGGNLTSLLSDVGTTVSGMQFAKKTPILATLSLF